MKTLELNLPTPVLLVWGLPEDAYEFDVFRNRQLGSQLVYLSNYERYGDLPECKPLPDGNWQLIGKLSELTEDRAKTLVDRVFLGYRDYDSIQQVGVIHYLDTALQSFHSAVEAEGYFVPSDKPMISDFGNYLNDEGVLSLEGYELYADALKEWQDAQSKTLPANTLIFKRV